MNYFYFCLENKVLNENQSSELEKKQENHQKQEDLINAKTDITETIEEANEIKKDRNLTNSDDRNEDVNLNEGDQIIINLFKNNEQEEVKTQENNSFIFLCAFMISFLIYQIITSSFFNSLILNKCLVEQFENEPKHNFTCVGYCLFKINIRRLMIKFKYQLTKKIGKEENFFTTLVRKEQNTVKYYEIYNNNEEEISEENFLRTQLYAPLYIKEGETCKIITLSNKNVFKAILALIIIFTTIQLILLVLFMIQNNDFELSSFFFTTNTQEKEEDSRDKFFLFALYKLLLEIIFFMFCLNENTTNFEKTIETILDFMMFIVFILQFVMIRIFLIYSILYFKEILEKKERTQEEEFLVYSLSIYYFLVLLSILFFGKRTLSWLFNELTN